MKPATLVAVGVLVVGLAGAGWRFWPWSPAPAEVPAPAPVAAVPAAAPAAPLPASAPVVRHPIEAIEPPPSPTPAPPTDLLSALADVFGVPAVRNLFQTDGFATRVVATVDNLGRRHAPARTWPVNPTPGRFMAEKLGEGEVIAAENARRYTPFVQMVESVPPQRVVALYRQFYPQFQRAYEELGYPGRYFNDRLVEVLDTLLATPDAAAPVHVRLPVIGGPIQPVRPWVMYEIDEPAFKDLSAGQELLLRMGADNQRRMKQRLAEIRRLVAGTVAPR